MLYYVIIVLSKFDLKDRHKVFTLYLMEMNYECACFLTVNITLVTLRKPIKKKKFLASLTANMVLSICFNP